MPRFKAAPYFINALKDGKTFGEANRVKSQRNFYSMSYALIGAGTLLPKAYLPYYDFNILNLSNAVFDKYKLWYIRKGVEFNNVTVKNGGDLKIISGKDIIINPDFLADYGSKLDLSVDKSLDY